MPDKSITRRVALGAAAVGVGAMASTPGQHTGDGAAEYT